MAHWYLPCRNAVTARLTESRWHMPNSATGLSPYPLVHGRELHSPADLLYIGWVEECLKDHDVSVWAKDVASRVEMLREFACLKQKETHERRKNKWDIFDIQSRFKENNLVLLRTPGSRSKLDEA